MINVMPNLHTTKCIKCNYQMKFNDAISRLIDAKSVVKEKGFYGNNVKYFCEAKCPCGEEYILYLKPASRGYSVIDIATKEKTTSARKKEAV